MDTFQLVDSTNNNFNNAPNFLKVRSSDWRNICYIGDVQLSHSPCMCGVLIKLQKYVCSPIMCWFFAIFNYLLMCWWVHCDCNSEYVILPFASKHTRNELGQFGVLNSSQKADSMGLTHICVCNLGYHHIIGSNNSLSPVHRSIMF